MEYDHPLTIQVVEHVELPIGKTNTPVRKEFLLAPIKKIATLYTLQLVVDMLWLHAYLQIQKHYAYPNYDVILERAYDEIKGETDAAVLQSLEFIA